MLELLRELGQRASQAPARSYVACPVCGTRMARKNHAGVSGIILHQCAEHGTWADHDAALRFVELMPSGDEARLIELDAQRRELELDRRLARIDGTQHAQSQRLSALDLRTRMHLIFDVLDII